jgi:hypothetical protein
VNRLVRSSTTSVWPSMISRPRWARLNDAGFRTIGASTDDDWHEIYVHPRDAAGCLIQVARTAPDFGQPVPVMIDKTMTDEWSAGAPVG